MPYLRASQARTAFVRSNPDISVWEKARAAGRLRREAEESPIASFDVFLSHSSNDAVLIGGIKQLLQNLGLTVYVDWIDDPELDRKHVTVRTAGWLRRRMMQSASLVYADTPSAGDSVWMPWELGYADGLHGRVAVLPVVTASDDEYDGREFVGLYRKIELVGGSLGLGPRAVPSSLRSWVRQR